jgi:hypothetical protein
MPKAKKLDPDHFNRPPVLNMKTSEQKFMYEGLRAFSDDEGILEHDIQFLILRIFGDNRRYKHFLSNMSALEKMGAIVRYESDGKKYIVLPHHFDIEGRIQYFSPTIHPRPSVEFYKRYQHYAKELKTHLERVKKSSEGGQRVAEGGMYPLTPSARPRGCQRVPEGARGSQRVGEGLDEKGFAPIQAEIDKILGNVKSVKRSHDSEKTFKEKKEESLKGEKGEKIDLKRILTLCGDKQSVGFYKSVLRKCPQEMIRSALIETKSAIQERWKTGGLTKPGAYFTKVIIELASKQGIRLKK